MGKRKFPTLYSFKPKTGNQARMQDEFESHHLLVKGPAGTGKTAFAISLSLLAIKKSHYNQLVILRNNCPVDDVGFLPGSYEEKLSPYSAPYSPIIYDLFKGATNLQCLEEFGYIKFDGVAFLRGQTFDNSIILVDESENMTYQMLDTIITRVGENTKIIFIGDEEQTDNKQSGWVKFGNVLDRMPSFRRIEFGVDDIVRSDLVAEYIRTKHEYLHSG